MNRNTILGFTSAALLLAQSALGVPLPGENDRPAKLKTMHCYLQVHGKVYLDAPCLVYPMGEGGYTLNAWSRGKPAQSHFAVVSSNGDGSADATWNADADDDRAGDALGVLNQAKGCWVGRNARICAR
jgi:hypothetical protein